MRIYNEDMNEEMVTALFTTVLKHLHNIRLLS